MNKFLFLIKCFCFIFVFKYIDQTNHTIVNLYQIDSFLYKSNRHIYTEDDPNYILLLFNTVLDNSCNQVCFNRQSLLPK
jgi:hypothetical protein